MRNFEISFRNNIGYGMCAMCGNMKFEKKK